MTDWGHKITVHLYVAGDAERAQVAVECVTGQLWVPSAEFVGVSIEVVQDAPHDQGASRLASDEEKRDHYVLRLDASGVHAVENFIAIDAVRERAAEIINNEAQIHTDHDYTAAENKALALDPMDHNDGVWRYASPIGTVIAVYFEETP